MFISGATHISPYMAEGSEEYDEEVKGQFRTFLLRYERRISQLERERAEEREHRQKIEEWAESVKGDYERLKAWVSELKEPPTHGCVVIQKREKDAIVLGPKGLETVYYGKIKEEEVQSLEPGQRVFVGLIPTTVKDPVTNQPMVDQMTGKPVVKHVPGITEVWKKEEAPLMRGRIVTIDPGEEFGLIDEDLVVVSFDQYKNVSLKVPKEKVRSFKLKGGASVDCLPETLHIKRVREGTDVSKYEVIIRPNVSFDDIGGLREAKMEIIRSIINPMVNPDDYERYRKAPRRILFHGPPGCGKTMLAQALASTLKNCGFYRVNAGEIYYWLLGSSAENLRNIFKMAVKGLEDEDYDNMIIFLDEIDALAPHRGIHPGASGAEERVVGQLLAILEGFDKLPPNLTVIGATNLPILVDSAVRQRFDKIIKVPQPSDAATVREIASKYIRPDKVPIDRHLIDTYGDILTAAQALVKELVGFLFEDEEIPTRYARGVKKSEVITGRLIAQIVEYAKDRALDDRTVYKIGKGAMERIKDFNIEKVLEISDVERRFPLLEGEYRNAEEIGINFNHLKEGFETFKVERAEEMLAAIERYRLEEPRPPYHSAYF